MNLFFDFSKKEGDVESGGRCGGDVTEKKNNGCQSENPKVELEKAGMKSKEKVESHGRNRKTEMMKSRCFLERIGSESNEKKNDKENNTQHPSVDGHVIKMLPQHLLADRQQQLPQLQTQKHLFCDIFLSVPTSACTIACNSQVTAPNKNKNENFLNNTTNNNINDSNTRNIKDSNSDNRSEQRINRVRCYSESNNKTCKVSENELGQKTKSQTKKKLIAEDCEVLPSNNKNKYNITNNNNNFSDICGHEDSAKIKTTDEKNLIINSITSNKNIKNDINNNNNISSNGNSAGITGNNRNDRKTKNKTKNHFITTNLQKNDKKTEKNKDYLQGKFAISKNEKNYLESSI